MFRFMSISFGEPASRESYLRRKDERNETKRQAREDWRREHYAGYEKLSGLRMRKERSDWLSNPTNGRIDPPKNSGEGSYYVGH